METISEHSASIKVELPKKDVHSKMPVFFNPIMKSNRNISILLLNSIENEQMNLALPLAGSGIRAIRFLKELKKGKINHIFVNDNNPKFKKTLTNNLTFNKQSTKKVSIFNEDASLFLLNQTEDKKKPEKYCGYFDYIDIDPFGTPNPFLSAAIARLCRNGVLAITATDTAALSGTYPKVTKRKYWATSQKNWMMHELGLRILIRKVQLIGMQFDKALIPVLAYHKDHYFRIYFQNKKGKTNCDNIINQHDYILFNPKTLDFSVSKTNKEKGLNQFAGPLWSGSLMDKSLLKKMVTTNHFPEEKKFLEQLSKEKDLVGFFDVHILAKKYKKSIPKIDVVLKKLRGTRTHFNVNGVKTNKKLADVVKLLK